MLAKDTRIDVASGHIPELDGLRGLAILLVTLYRFSRNIPGDTPAGFILLNGLALCERGVELFFVLSGFLITGILLRTKGRKHCFRNFIARRSLRIFPLYFASLAMCVIVVPQVLRDTNPFEQATQQQFYLWTYLTNVRMSWLNAWCFGSLDHFWSLAVEEHFYLFWPLVVFSVSSRGLFPLAFLGLLASACSRMVFAAWSDHDVAAEVLSCFRFDALLCGALLAIYWQTHDSQAERYRRWTVAATCFFALSIAASPFNRRLFTLADTLWPIAFATLIAIILLPQGQRLLAMPLRSNFMRSLGKYSYAMYVFQSPLIPLVSLLPFSDILFEAAGGTRSLLAHMGYILSMSMGTFGLAFCSWHLYEKHFLLWKARFQTD